MNILIIYPYLPHEKMFHGSAIRVHNYLKCLSQRNKVFIACFADEKNTKLIAELEPLCEKIFFVPTPNTVSRLWRVFHFLVSGTPNFVKHFKSNELVEKINGLLDDYTIDILHIEFVLLGGYLNLLKLKPSIKIILNIDEVISRVLNEKWRSINSFKKVFYYWQYVKIRNYELKICNQTDKIFTITSEEKNYLKSLRPELKISVIPNGVDSSFFKFNKKKINEKTTEQNIVFIGNYKHYPNKEAVLYFYNHIFPEIKLKVPEIIFNIVGANVPSVFEKLVQDPCVRLVGEVSDVRYYLKQSNVFVCPIISGGGFRGKVIEAMAWGIPVVSTSLGVAGIDIKRNIHAFIEDDPASFSKRVVDLLTGNNNDIDRMVNASREIIEKKYAWPIICQKLENEYNSLL